MAGLHSRLLSAGGSVSFGLLGAVLLPLALAGCSTPQICDQSCQAWDSTCGYSDYTYEHCRSECSADADWTQSYADCVVSADSCSEIEIVCETLF